MAHLTYTTYEGYGERAQKNLWYSQAVRVGDIIEASGQGGWDRQTDKVILELGPQIAQAFENVDVTLKAAGASWADVFSVKTYHAPLTEENFQLCLEQMKKWCPTHQPIWTALGIDRLGFPEMKFEIDVRAHVPVEKK